MKRATCGLPAGPSYFDCAINDLYFEECAVYQGDKLDCIQTYRNYYMSKDYFNLVWNKGTEDPPEWYKPDEFRSKDKKFYE